MKIIFRPLALPGAVATAVLVLGGCAVGPDFKPPAPPQGVTGAQYGSQPLPTQTAQTSGLGGAAQQLTVGSAIPAQWWALYQSPAVDQLVKLALTNSPTLAAAQATLRQAQEGYNALSGSLQYPSVNAQAGAGRERASAVSTNIPGGALYNLYNAQVNVSYTVDVFGVTRRALEGQRASVEMQRYQLEASYLALTSNVVTTAIREASLRAQLQATQELLKAQDQQYQVVERQYAAGAIGRQPMLAQANAVAQTRAGIPGLEKALAQTRHLLAVLVGQLPSQAGLPEVQLDTLQLPTDLPVSLPSELVRQRPDIRAGEAQLHQAAAAVGVAAANLYPQFNLTASYGSTAVEANKLFRDGFSFWSLIAGMTAPLYDGGSLRAKERAAQAGFEAAAGQYRSTVLNAFQNVADSLQALQDDARTLQAQDQATGLAKESFELANRQYQLGATSFLSMLDAQRSYQQSRITLVSAQAARFADTAALFQAMGGGWWNRGNLPDVPLTLQTQQN